VADVNASVEDVENRFCRERTMHAFVWIVTRKGKAKVETGR